MRGSPQPSDIKLSFLFVTAARHVLATERASQRCRIFAESLMHRRRFLRDGAAALSVAAFIDHFLFQNDAEASSPPSIGSEQPFDYARLKGHRTRASGDALSTSPG